MKWVFLFFSMLFLLTQAIAQNEFAATAFYKEFRKVYEDAQAGFTGCKGAKRTSGFEGISTEYSSKCILMLADSGKVVIPVTGNSYAIYYFEPDRVRLKIDQRGVNLREAIVTAFGKPLFARTETSIINNYPFTNTLYFAESDESSYASAIFRQCIYYQHGKYYLSLEIRGKKE